MKIRLDVIVFIFGILISNVVYFSYPSKQVWEKDGNYYDSETHETLENINPDNLVYIGQVINGDSYEVYRVLNPINLLPYILMIVTILSFILVQVLARFRGLNIPDVKF